MRFENPLSSRKAQWVFFGVALIFGFIGTALPRSFGLNVQNSDDLVYPVIMIGIGAFLFWNGFRKERIRRQVENLATSRVRSMAVGTVELGGWAEEFQPLFDPVHMKPCVYYDIQVQEYRNSGKSGYWKTIFEKSSKNHPFYFMDDTGRVLVIPEGAEFHGSYESQVKNFGLFQTKSGPEYQFVAKYCGSGFFSATRSRRLVMMILRVKTPMYILGFAKPLPHSLRDAGVSTAEAAKELKKSPEEMKKLDTNSDGQVDSFEWDFGVASKKKEMDQAKREKEAARRPDLVHVLTQPLVVGREADKQFIIADSEKALMSSLASSALWQVIFGPLLAAGGFVWLTIFIR